MNVDSEFYHNLLCKPGGVERICPWLKGAQRRIRQDGARPRASEGEIEDLKLVAMAMVGLALSSHKLLILLTPTLTT